MLGVLAVAVGMGAVGAAGPAGAASVALSPQTVSLPLQGVSLPVGISGQVSYADGVRARGDAPVPVEAQVSADLRGAQQRATEVVAALVNRDEKCGDRIRVTNGRLGARAPSLRLAADFDYERAACFGERQMVVLPQQPVSVDMLLAPVIDGRTVRFRAEVLSLRSQGQEMPEQVRGLLAAAIADRLDREASKLLGSAALPEAASLTRLAFDEAKPGRLSAQATGSAVLTPAQFSRLLALRQR